MRSSSPSLFLSLLRTHAHTHTHTHTHIHTRRKIMQKQQQNTRRCTQMDRKHTHNIHMQTLSVFLENHAGASLSFSLSLSLTHTHTHTHTHNTELNNILPLYSPVSRLNYSRAEWISKREDKRPSSFWNRFNMFVLFPARLWAGSASEKYEVIIIRVMERTISCSLFHPANHSNTSVLTSWVEFRRVCLSFPFSFFFFLFFTQVVYSAKHEINKPIQPLSTPSFLAHVLFIPAVRSGQISNKHRDKAAMQGQCIPAALLQIHHYHLATTECHPPDLLNRKNWILEEKSLRPQLWTSDFGSRLGEISWNTAGGDLKAV